MSEMKHRTLGKDGPQVSVVGLGCNNFGGRIDVEATRAVVDAALDEGITLFDTADIYGIDGGSERALGEVLNGMREHVVLATKFGMPMKNGPQDHLGRPEYVRSAIEDSLRRLQTDHVDLYQMHAPDVNTPIAETLGALQELVDAGKVRYLGNSNFNAEQLRDADATAKGARFVSAQNHYSLLYREIEADVIPACVEAGLGLLPYFPLANGLLTGKYRRGEDLPTGTRLGGNPERAGHVMTDQNMDRVEALERVASDAGVSLLHLAIGGLAAQPAVSSVIAGATKPEQVRANVEAGLWEPTPEILAAIDRAAPPPLPTGTLNL